ncbi:hypothetical protein KKD57_02215 [Patescibacteria group bacterium]|nr:hypothetical protein [Patescibacteria group bacterium]
MNIPAILNLLSFYLPLLWLFIILANYFKTHELNFKLIKYGIFVAIALFAITGAYSTIATYNAWKLDPFSRYLLPPHNPAYFYGYAYFNFWREAVVSFLAGAVWAGFLFLVKKYSGGRILDKNDVALGFFTAMIVGWPKIFAYFAIAFGLLILKGIINAVVLKDKNNIAIASSLALSALVVAGFSNFIMKLSFFDNWKL